MTRIVRKISIFTAVIACCITLNPGTAAAEGTAEWANRIVPVYDSFVVTPTPTGWQFNPVHKENKGNLTLMEFVPQGQTARDWKEMITVSGYRKSEMTPKEYFTSLYLLTQKICGRENTAAQAMGETPEAFAGLLMCGKPKEEAAGLGGLRKDQGEMAFYRIYAGDGGLFAIFHSWRGKAYDVKDTNDSHLPTTIKNMGRYVNASNATMVCNKSNPHGPCKDYAKFLSKE